MSAPRTGGGGFDEGSTTITQVQGLRGCRNAGIPVPKEVIDKAVKYIHNCTMKDGAVQYSSKGGGGRPAITAAAIACLYNAGEYDDEYVPRMLDYCREAARPRRAATASAIGTTPTFTTRRCSTAKGARRGTTYRDAVEKRILREATEVKIGDETAYMWQQGYVGPVYTTALNLIILQLGERVPADLSAVRERLEVGQLRARLHAIAWL